MSSRLCGEGKAPRHREARCTAPIVLRARWCETAMQVSDPPDDSGIRINKKVVVWYLTTYNFQL